MNIFTTKYYIKLIFIDILIVKRWSQRPVLPILEVEQ